MDIRPTQLDEVIAAFLKEEEAGRHPDREEWIRKHPLVADGLREFFRDHDSFKAMAGRRGQVLARGTARIDLMKKAAPKDIAARGWGTPSDSRQTGPAKFGDYELGAEIARGGMGVVYLARQVSLDRPVALKMMLETCFAHPDDVRRFRHEARAAGRLEHPHIVPIYDVGEWQGRQYYTMRLVSGGNLGDAMAALRKDPRRAVRLMITIAKAVDHAHRHGILHRDLKPANILLDGDGMPHVVDFGLAKRMDDPGSFTLTTEFLGTVSYTSPEQSFGGKQRLTAASDVYSLGAMFYEMLTGKPPFHGDDVMSILLRVREEFPAHPASRNPDVDRSLATICMKCLEKQPAQRYPSAKALAEDLEAWLEERPIAARPPSMGRRIVRWVGRHPALVAAAVMALVIVGTAGLTLLLREGGVGGQSVGQESTGLALQRGRTVDLAYALMDKGKTAMARQLLEEIVNDGNDPLEIMEAEEGLKRLTELGRSISKRPAKER